MPLLKANVLNNNTNATIYFDVIDTWSFVVLTWYQRRNSWFGNLKPCSLSCNKILNIY